MGESLQSNYRRNLYGIAGFAVVLVIVGFAVTASYPKTMLIFSMINAIAAIGLCLLFGYGGQISLCQGAMFGLGAYTAADLVQKLSLDPILGILGATALPAAVGWLIARPLLRLSTHYLAMATLGFGLIMSIFFAQLQPLTGGADPGVMNLPPFQLLSVELSSANDMFWVCAVMLLLTMLIVINLIHTRIGRALTSIRSSEVAAASLGIDTVQYKVALFSMAAGLAGLGGGLYAYFTRAFNSSSFEFGFSIDLLTMVLIGSVRNPWGALVGALVINFLPASLESFDHYKLFTYGVLMAVVMIFMPEGLVSALIEFTKNIVNRKRDA